MFRARCQLEKSRSIAAQKSPRYHESTGSTHSLGAEALSLERRPPERLVVGKKRSFHSHAAWLSC
jgi:hypothetical protein